MNLSLKNTQLWLKIPEFKFIQTKLKTVSFSKKNGLQIRIIDPWNNETIREYKKRRGKDKDGENVPRLESVEVHINSVKNDYQQTSTVLFIFVPNKQFGQLKNISPHSLTLMNTVNTEFSSIEIWFTDQ